MGFLCKEHYQGDIIINPDKCTQCVLESRLKDTEELLRQYLIFEDDLFDTCTVSVDSPKKQVETYFDKYGLDYPKSRPMNL
jgi:hypothetical protein